MEPANNEVHKSMIEMFHKEETKSLSKEEAERLQKQKDIYEMLEKMSRRERRSLMKKMPKFSDVIKKQVRAKNIKEIIDKRGLNE